MIWRIHSSLSCSLWMSLTVCFYSTCCPSSFFQHSKMSCPILLQWVHILLLSQFLSPQLWLWLRFCSLFQLLPCLGLLPGFVKVGGHGAARCVDSVLLID